MRAGDLRYRLDLQQRTLVPNADAESVSTWTAWQTVWAQVEPWGRKHGQVRYLGPRLQAEVTHRITIRFMPAFPTTALRGVCNGVVYDFEAAVDPDGRRRELAIDAVVRN